jgi:hypothetical protein
VRQITAAVLGSSVPRRLGDVRGADAGPNQTDVHAVSKGHGLGVRSARCRYRGMPG